MTDAPLVTVVITTRNRRHWLERCVDSVRRQEGLAFELIVVDDASIDDTKAWLATLGDPRVSVIHLEAQSGISEARNRGLVEATAPLVMFLDDDDWLERGALRALSTGLDAHPESVAAVGARRVWFTAERYARRDSHPHVPRLRNIVDELLLDWSAVSGQNLYRTALVRQIGGYDASVVQCEDRDLWLRLAVLGPVVLRPETVMTYRVHPGQTRPPNLRELREVVARQAIAALPQGEQPRAVRLRRTTRLLDEAEVAFAAGHLRSGVVNALRAVLTTPAAFASPLIGPWTIRRLGGRLARRFVVPPKG